VAETAGMKDSCKWCEKSASV